MTFQIFYNGQCIQHVTLQQIISNVSSLYMTQLAGTEPNNFQQVLKVIELKSIFTTKSD